MKKLEAKAEVARTPSAIKDTGGQELYMPGSVTVRQARGAPSKYLLEHLAFDFKGCTRPDLLRLTAQQLVITLQSRFRNVYTDRDGNATGDPLADAARWDRTFNVKTDFIEAARTVKDPIEKAEMALAGLTEEQRAELFARYPGEQK